MGAWGLCDCTSWCGDDGDIDGDGICKGLRRRPDPPPVEIVVVRRDELAASREEEHGAA
jgi:hypothetical protein